MTTTSLTPRPQDFRGAPVRAIRVLPPELVSRIAAGEVVERPASIVKEAVENALDASARRIHVELLSGGRELIRISDDGSGMSPADLALCVLPHATSKIHSAEDLERLATLGFRGEALPSIAAVSKFSLLSRARRHASSAADQEDQAWKIELDGGRPENPRPHPAAGAFGTTLEARELFFNLPAREKFLKGPAAEAAACTDTLLRLALTRPDVAFTLKAGAHEIISLSACGQTSAAPPQASASPALPLSAYLRRARDVLGDNASKGLLALCAQGPALDTAQPDFPVQDGSAQIIPLSDSYRGYRLYGLISPPAVTRPNRSSLYLTVNGRAVKDRTLTGALLESYRHLLPPRRFPAAVLFLELPDADVDINVHPTKSEVRFRLPGLVYALFHHAVRAACGLLDASSAAPIHGDALLPAAPAKPPLGAPRPLNGQKVFDLWPRGEASRTASPQRLSWEARDQDFSRAITSDANEPFPREVSQSGASLAAEAPAHFNAPAAPVDRHAPPSPPPTVETAAPAFRVLGQAAGSYIILEDDCGVKLIDQHALHERILFEELLARAEGRSRGDAQGLLIAETLELTPVQAAVFAQDAGAAEVLSKLGFDVESFGPRTVAVRAVPAILKSDAAAGLVRDVLDALAGSGDEPGGLKKTARSSLREKAAYVLSCKGALKAGERLTREQMEALVHEFRKKVGGHAAFTCPHGRPLALELSWEELEKAVGRR